MPLFTIFKYKGKVYVAGTRQGSIQQIIKDLKEIKKDLTMKQFTFKDGFKCVASTKEDAIAQHKVIAGKQIESKEFIEWLKNNYKSIKGLSTCKYDKKKDKYIEKVGKFTLSYTIHDINPGIFIFTSLHEGEKTVYLDSDSIRMRGTLKEYVNILNKNLRIPDRYLKFKDTGFKGLFNKSIKKIIDNNLFKDYDKNEGHEYRNTFQEYFLVKEDSGLTYKIKIEPVINHGYSSESEMDTAYLDVSFFIKTGDKVIVKEKQKYNIDDNVTKAIYDKMNELDASISKKKEKLQKVGKDYEKNIASINKNTLVKKVNSGVKLLISSKLPNLFKSCEIVQSKGKSAKLKLFLSDTYKKKGGITILFNPVIISGGDRHWKKLSNVLDTAYPSLKFTFLDKDSNDNEYWVTYAIKSK